MPILLSSPVRVCDQEEYHRIDHQVTGFAFDIQNEFGRFLGEDLYQCELGRRCRNAGMDIVTEFQMTAVVDGFRKDYFADILIDRSVLVEIKAVSALGGAHRGQLLNYLFFCGLHHGTILNFRSPRVQREFISTGLTATDRVQFEVATEGWKILTPRCGQLHSSVIRVLNELGAYLDPALYRDAASHFLGGEGRVSQDVEVFSENTVIGRQPMRLLSEDVAFSVTSATQHPETIFKHQLLLLKHTRLRAIQWINLDHSRVEFRTIENQ